MGFVLIALSFLFAVAAQADCGLKVQDSAYSKTADGAYVYTLDFSPAPAGLWDAGQEVESQRSDDLRRSLSALVDTAPLALLKRSRGHFAAVSDGFARGWFDGVITGRIGAVGPMTCLQSYLWANHLAQFSAQTEFAASIFLRDEGGVRSVRIFVKTNGGLGVSNGSGQEEFIRARHAGGWRFIAHFHNHPLVVDDLSHDIGGALVPSEADVEFYEKLIQTAGLEAAWITNGFQTITLTPKDIAYFSAAPKLY
jgi:hypothetical protein